MSAEISKKEILSFQKEWGDALVKVGKLFVEKKGYKQAAIELVNQFYGYEESTVLFKPTRAQHVQFRENAKSALSYFIGGDPEFDEDTGFALQPWTRVRFENSGFILDGNCAVSMGNYFFTDVEDEQKQVEYTMGIFRTKDGSLKMNLHHSSLPYLHPKHNK